MGFLDKLFGRKAAVVSKPVSAPVAAPALPLTLAQVATKDGVLEHDLWLYLGHQVKKIIPSGSKLPARNAIVISNDTDHAKQLIVLVLSGPAGKAPPDSVLLPTLLMVPKKPDWRLEMQVRIEIEINGDGVALVRVKDMKTNLPLATTSAQPPAQCDAPWKIDGLRPNCLQWEEFLAKRYQFVIGDRFEVLDTLTRSGFGVIYVVIDRQTPMPKRVHLLKALREDLSSKTSSRVEFMCELALWKSLGKHPNIVALDYEWEYGGQMYGAMDWVIDKEAGHGNTTLTQFLAPGLTTSVAAKWALDFCCGMEYLKSRGVKAHLDIKPDNLLIDHQENCLKIADFGLVVVDEAVFEQKLERTPLEDKGPLERFEGQTLSCMRRAEGTIHGTPGYMAPEIWEGRVAWERTDIFSFGVVLWQMSMRTRELPYSLPRGRNIHEICAAIYAQQMKGVFPAVPGPLSKVVARCLAPKPEDRYCGFSELGNAIRAAMAMEDILGYLGNLPKNT